MPFSTSGSAVEDMVFELKFSWRWRALAAVLILLLLVGLPVALTSSAAEEGTTENDFKRGERLMDEGKLTEAEQLFRELLRNLMAAHGPNYPGVVDALSFLAEVFDKRKDFPEAEKLQRAAVETAKGNPSIDETYLKGQMQNLGLMLFEHRKFSEEKKHTATCLMSSPTVLEQTARLWLKFWAWFPPFKRNRENMPKPRQPGEKPWRSKKEYSATNIQKLR